MGENHTTPCMAREQGRNAALAGREIFVNPHVGIDADAWFEGYREVPEVERGTRPDLKRPSSAVARKPRRTLSSEAGIRALGDKCLPGSTPKPWATEGAGA